MPATTTLSTPTIPPGHVWDARLGRPILLSVYYALHRLRQRTTALRSPVSTIRPLQRWESSQRNNDCFDYENYRRGSRITRRYGVTQRPDARISDFGRLAAKWIADYRSGKLSAAEVMREILSYENSRFRMWERVRRQPIFAEIYLAQSDVRLCGCTGLLSLVEGGQVIGGVWFCAESVRQYAGECDTCGNYFRRNDLISVNGDEICRDCFDAGEYETCRSCGCYVAGDSALRVTNAPPHTGQYVCCDCQYDEDDCGNPRYDRTSDTTVELTHGLIARYNETFTGPLGKLPANRSRSHVMACELEMEVDNRTAFARSLRKIRKQNDCHCKHDGSLSSECGVEVVTGYGSRRALHKVLADVCKIANNYNGQSHNGAACGLHICLDRSDLTDRQIARVIVFWNRHDNYSFLRVFTRRDYWHNSYCAGKHEKGTAEFLSRSNPNYYPDKYEVVNVLHDTHLEFRAFRGSLIPSTLKACTALVSLCVSYCRGARKRDQLTASDFCRWVRDKVKDDDSRRVDLVKYLANKRSSLDSFIKAN